MDKQVTKLEKVITEVEISREEVEEMIVTAMSLPKGAILTFDWNDYTGSVRVCHVTETVVGA